MYGRPEKLGTEIPQLLWRWRRQSTTKGAWASGIEIDRRRGRRVAGWSTTDTFKHNNSKANEDCLV